MKKIIRVGSRDSKLAIIQAELVIAAIKMYDPELQTELVTMKTAGDRILDITLDKAGGKGLFVKELEQALYKNEVDITVHSYKDMPLEENPGLPVVALSKREDPRDALILPEQYKACIKDAPIGSSSLRRQLQLGCIFPGKALSPIRGNLQTRLKKLDDGEYSAIVLAAAGMKRLGLESRISRYFATEEILPAASQGIIAVQGRAGERFEYLGLFHNQDSQVISVAERAFVSELNGGCSTPTAAYAVTDGSEIVLTGMYYNKLTGEVKREHIGGERNDAAKLGYELAKKMRG